MQIAETAADISHSALSLERLDDELVNIYRTGQPFVSIEQFLKDDYYFGRVAKDIWPENIPDLLDIFAPDKNYLEVILTGATSIGKTFLACISMAYIIGQLGNYTDPHKWVGAASSSPIIFINMSITAGKAKDIVYTRTKNMIDSSPYFQESFRRDTRITDSLVWRKDNIQEGYHSAEKIRLGPSIVFKYGTGDSLSALGDDIFGGAGDELNFFRIIERSRKASGEAYDPAERLYATVSRRMKGRFSSGGKTLGKFFLLSSAQYPDDFIERRVREAEEDGSLGKTVKLIKRSTWEAKKGVSIQGKPVFSNKTFRVEVGTSQRGSRILDAYSASTGAVTPTITKDIVGKVINPPVDFWSDFSRDVEGSVRDFGGEVTRAIKPFFEDTSIIWESVRLGTEAGLAHPWSVEETTLQDGSHLLVDVLFEHVERDDGKGGKEMHWRPKRHPMAPRYFHIDLGVSGDPAGVAVVHAAGWRRSVDAHTPQDTPIIETDLMLRIIPPHGGRINLASVRGVIFALREHGVWFRSGSLDQFQSEDTIQTFNSNGIHTEKIPDKIEQYNVLKDACFSGRLMMYNYPPVTSELIGLEDTKGAIDHAPGMHDDVSRALSHACYNLFVSDRSVSPENIQSMMPRRAAAPPARLTTVARQRQDEDEFRKMIGGRPIARRR